MKFSDDSLAFIKEQELNPNWDGFNDDVEETSLLFDNVVIKKISHCYSNVMKVMFYSKNQDIVFDVYCTPHHDVYLYNYSNNIVSIPNTIRVSLPMKKLEDCS